MYRVATILLAVSLPAWSQAALTASLRGIVTDPSGAAIPGGVVQLRGPGFEKRVRTDDTGRYSFPALKAGKYQVRITAKGFALTQKNLVVERPAFLNAQLSIEAGRDVVNVGDENGRVGTEPESNGGLVMRERQLATLSDDPDELALQLQALAGPRARAQRRTNLYRRVYGWRQSAPQGFHPRDPHQLESVFTGVRSSRLRADRNLHQAG